MSRFLTVLSPWASQRVWEQRGLSGLDLPDHRIHIVAGMRRGLGGQVRKVRRVGGASQVDVACPIGETPPAAHSFPDFTGLTHWRWRLP